MLHGEGGQILQGKLEGNTLPTVIALLDFVIAKLAFVNGTQLGEGRLIVGANTRLPFVATKINVRAGVSIYIDGAAVTRALLEFHGQAFNLGLAGAIDEREILVALVGVDCRDAGVVFHVV